MDVNYILTREQIERARARSATHPGARAAHQGLAEGYREMVDSYRHGNDAAEPSTAGPPAGRAPSAA